MSEIPAVHRRHRQTPEASASNKNQETAMTDASTRFSDTSTSPRGSKPIWVAGLRAALVAATAAELVATVGRIAGVPLRAGGLGASEAQTIPPGWFALATIFCGAPGTGLAVIINRWSRRPLNTFAGVALALTAASFITPIGAGMTTTATKVLLCAAHVVAAAIMIPGLRRALRCHS